MSQCKNCGGKQQQTKVKSEEEGQECRADQVLNLEPLELDHEQELPTPNPPPPPPPEASSVSLPCDRGGRDWWRRRLMNTEGKERDRFD